MSLQKKLIEDILSSYNIIEENKKFVFESSATLRSTLSSLGYTEKSGQLTSGGEVNDKLTDIVAQILTSYKKAAPTVAVTITAGNDKYHHGLGYKSQHTLGNAIDVTLNPYNTQNANVFINILNSTKSSNPGFTYIDEYKNPSKASTGGHFHLQYGTDTTTSNSGTTTQSANTTTQSADTETQSIAKSTSSRDFAKSFGQEIVKAVGIAESFKPGAFGSNAKLSRGKILIPRNSNLKIKCPVSGKIIESDLGDACSNQIIVEFEDGFLQYCGISNPLRKTGDLVGVGTVLGTTHSNVTVTLYSENKKKEPIVFEKENNKSKERNRDDDKNDLSGKSGYSQLVIKGIRNVKKSFDKKKEDKIEENIKRIKGLL